MKTKNSIYLLATIVIAVLGFVFLYSKLNQSVAPTDKSAVQSLNIVEPTPLEKYISSNSPASIKKDGLRSVAINALSKDKTSISSQNSIKKIENKSVVLNKLDTIKDGPGIR